MIHAHSDLHEKFTVITLMDAQGKETVERKKLPNNREIIDLWPCAKKFPANLGHGLF
jgi:hypothetical protein